MTAIGPKQPRLRDERYLAFVRRQSCCVCGAPAPSDAAHVRYQSLLDGKRSTGLAEKPDDRWAVPMNRSCHRLQHSMNERDFWAMKGIDPLAIAQKLYAIGGHPDAPQPKRKRKTITPKGFARRIASRPFPKTQRDR